MAHIFHQEIDVAMRLEAAGIEEDLGLLAQPFSVDELTYVDDLLASATPEEWASIQEDPISAS